MLRRVRVHPRARAVEIRSGVRAAVACPKRRSSGQAAPEYVGLLAIVAVCLASAGAVAAAPDLPRAVAAKLRHGLCLVAGSVCDARQARAAGLQPCRTRLTASTERTTATVLVVRLGREDAVLVESRSDHKVLVSFADGWRGGGELGVGLRFPGFGIAGRAAVGAGASFTAGRTWEFASAQEARDFLSRYGGSETTAGEAVALARRACPVCRRRKGPQQPDAEYLQGGAYSDIAAELGFGAGRAELRAGLAGVLGRRLSGRRTTWYVALSNDLTGRLGAVLGVRARGHAGGQAVLALTLEDGREIEASFVAGAQVDEGIRALGFRTDLAELSERLGGLRRDPAASTGEGGFAGRLQMTLDLRDPRNHRAVRSFVAALNPRLASPLTLDDRARELAQRIDADARVDFEVHRTSRAGRRRGVGGGLGAQLAGEHERVDESQELVAAWSLAPGDVFRRREDCVAS